LLLLLVAILGCGLFEPRQPRPAVVFPEPCHARTTADSVVVNIVRHYGRATSCYADQVDTGFVFGADIQDSLDREIQTPNPFENWNPDVEIRVSQDVSRNFDSIQVYLDSTYASAVTSSNPTRETRYYYYHLLVFHSPLTTRYQGQAEMTFVQRSTDFTLESFRDHRDGSGLPTWGSLRASQR
jgi:hypothetical protein